MSVDDLCNMVVSCLAASKQDKVEQRFAAHQIWHSISKYPTIPKYCTLANTELTNAPLQRSTVEFLTPHASELQRVNVS